MCACQACRHWPWLPGVEVPAFPLRLPPSILSGLFSRVLWRGRFPFWLLLFHRFCNSGFGGAGVRCTSGGAPWAFFAVLVRAVRVFSVREFLAQQILSAVSCSLSLFFLWNLRQGLERRILGDVQFKFSLNFFLPSLL